MPYEIKFEHPPAGHAVQAAKKGETATIQFLEFTSTEDGQHFIRRLEGVPAEILRRLSDQVQVPPSQVDSLLAIIRKDGSATIFLNELPQIVSVRFSRATKRGDAVDKNDIVDIAELRLGDVDIPADCSVVLLFSVGWRKGYFYDFGPTGADAIPRSYDCAKVFGQCYTNVLFQERLSIADDEWEAFFKSKWFPFSGLKHDTTEKFIEYVRAGWDPDELTERVIEEVNGYVDRFLESWSRHPVFKPHLAVLRRAIEHFQNDDYLSCAGLLYPRIEGIMRGHADSNGGGSTGQCELADAAVASKTGNPTCLLLPRKFNEYLKDVYFATFTPGDEDIGASRNSVSHGVAAPDRLDAKAAVIGILVAHQLFYCCEYDTNELATTKTSDNHDGGETAQADEVGQQNNT